MAYKHTNSKGDTYYLHAKEAELRGGKRTIYFFSKEEKEGAINKVPNEYIVDEVKKTGLPVLKKKNKEQNQNKEQRTKSRER